MLGSVDVLDEENRKSLESSSITIQFNLINFVPFPEVRCTVLGTVRGPSSAMVVHSKH
jgi:hypothetical protein